MVQNGAFSVEIILLTHKKKLSEWFFQMLFTTAKGFFYDFGPKKTIFHLYKKVTCSPFSGFPECNTVA